MSVDKVANNYNIRPPFEKKFNPAVVKEQIRLILIEELGDKIYEAEDAATWSKAIAETVQNKMRELPYDNYKFVVQVVIGERKGGMKMCSRCLWDADTDNFTSEILTLETLFCLVAVFATYYY